MINYGEVTGQRKGSWGLQGVVNCAKVTRKCMVNKACLVRFVMQIKAGLLFLVWPREAPLQMKMYVPFTKGNMCTVLGQKGGGQRVLPVSAVSQLTSA